MIKNATGQHISFIAIATADGAAVTTGTPTVYLSKDGAAQATSSNTASHLGNGVWVLDLTQAETNADHLSAVMVLTNAVNSFAQAFPVVQADFKADVSSLATAAALTTVDTVVDAIKVVTDALPNSGALSDLATAASQTSISSAISALNDFDPAADTVANVTTVGSVTSAVTTSNASDVTAIKAVTDNLPDSGALTSIATASSLSTVDTVVDGIKSVTDNLPDSGALTSLATAASISGLNDFDPATDEVTVATNNDKTGYSISGVKQTLDSLNDIQATDIVSGGAITTSGGAVSNVTLVATTTTNTDMLTVGAIADAVWDELFSGHNVAGSFGKIVRQIYEGVVSKDGQVDDTGATATTFITNLTETTDGFYHDKVIVFTSGDLSGQARHIETYTGSTKSVTVSQAFTSAPADSDEFLILSTHEHSLNEISQSTRTEMDANSTKLASIQTIADKLNTAMVLDGAVWQFTVNALENAPSGGGGGGGLQTDVAYRWTNSGGGSGYDIVTITEEE